MSGSDFKLLLLFIFLSSSLIFRILVEKTGYVSPDSSSFLELSQNIIDSKGFYYLEKDASGKPTKIHPTYFAIWPLGYPVLIAFFAYIFSLPVFWASKLLNLFFLGLSFLIFRKMNKQYAFLLALNFCSFTFLEVFSYTWSEAPFIFGMLWFGYSLYRFSTYSSKIYLINLIFSCLFLFLIRYIGAFSVAVLGVAAIWFMVKRNINIAIKLLLIISFLCIFISLYLYYNYLQTGYITGGERVLPFKENLLTFVNYLFIGLFNEFFIIRNYYWKDSYPDLLFWFTSSFQIVLMIVIYLKYLKGNLFSLSLKGDLSTFYLIIGLIYLLSLIVLRFLSPFDPFDYRLLSPFSICIYTSLILYLLRRDQSHKIKGAFKYITIFFLISLVLNLPKVYLLEALQKILLK